MAAVDVLEILSPGILASVQDTGRLGFGQIGVAPSGAADAYACRIGNLLVGNLENAAALEITLMGFQARFRCEAVFAVTGADLQPSLNGNPIPLWSVLRAKPGDILDLPSPVCCCQSRCTSNAVSRSSARSRWCSHSSMVTSTSGTGHPGSRGIRRPRTV